jgi:hypothetical protein
MYAPTKAVRGTNPLELPRSAVDCAEDARMGGRVRILEGILMNTIAYGILRGVDLPYREALAGEGFGRAR